MTCKPEGRGFLSVNIDLSKNLECRIAFAFRDGLFGFVPAGRHLIVRHDLSQSACGFESHPSRAFRAVCVRFFGEWAGNMLKECVWTPLAKDG